MPHVVNANGSMRDPQSPHDFDLFRVGATNVIAEITKWGDAQEQMEQANQSLRNASLHARDPESLIVLA